MEQLLHSWNDSGAKQAIMDAEKNNWTVVDMKKDWKYVFPFEKRDTAALQLR